MNKTASKSFTSQSGAYIEEGPLDHQLYASVGSDGLVAVIEMITDCPGQCCTYFMRGGITEGQMTVAECLAGARALVDLVNIATLTWPRLSKGAEA